MTFQQGSQFGYLNPDRITVTPINAFADGSTNQDGVPVDTRVNLHGLINTFSLYATDTLTVGKSLAFTFSGRYNRTPIDNVDRLPPSPVAGVRGSLNGQYVFERFNPAAGLTYSPTRFASVYFSYSEASRAPTAIELGCADPTEPCNLPNALVSDPPLKQVVTRTFEAGVRGTLENNLRWSAGWFRGENYNDLLFVASRTDRLRLFHQLRPDPPAGRRSQPQRSSREVHPRRQLHVSRRDVPELRRPSTEGSNSSQRRRTGNGRQHHGPAGRSHSANSANILKAYAEYRAHRENLRGSRLRCGGTLLRPRQREQSGSAGRHLLPRAGILARLRSGQSRGALSGAEASAVLRADRQPARPPLLHRRATWLPRPLTTLETSSSSRFPRSTGTILFEPLPSSRRAHRLAPGEGFGSSFEILDHGR